MSPLRGFVMSVSIWIQRDFLYLWLVVSWSILINVETLSSINLAVWRFMKETGRFEACVQKFILLRSISAKERYGCQCYEMAWDSQKDHEELRILLMSLSDSRMKSMEFLFRWLVKIFLLGFQTLGIVFLKAPIFIAFGVRILTMIVNSLPLHLIAPSHP